MATSEVNWVNVDGLRQAALRLQAQARKFHECNTNLQNNVGAIMVNPATFGTDSSGKQFYSVWNTYTTDWNDGVRNLDDTIRATAAGVDRMADAFHSADMDTSDMADDLGRFVNGGALSGAGSGTTVRNPNLPDLGGVGDIGDIGGGDFGGGTHVRH